MRKSLLLIGLASLSLVACDKAPQEAADLKLNDLGYFETRGVNVLVFSNTFSGGFNDEKNSGIEIIHHGVRTVQGGAVRLNKTPEQWDLVPASPSRTVDTLNNSIEVTMRYTDYALRLRFIWTIPYLSSWSERPVSTWSSCLHSTGARPTLWTAVPTVSRAMQ